MINYKDANKKFNNVTNYFKSDKEKLAEQLYDLGYNYVSGYMSWNHHKEKTIETYVKDYTKEELQCIILSLL